VGGDPDPGGDRELLAAWIAKEQLRFLLSLARQHAPRAEISNRLFAFYD